MKKGLGKGLDALFNVSESEDTLNESVIPGIVEININDIEPNSNQPRKKFDESKLINLSESIKNHGVVQPIIVKKSGDYYKIVAGERRWRASRLAGLKTIPAIIKDMSSRQVMEIALIENIQREDLNPIEEADAYNKLINDFKLTHEDLSKVIGKSRSSITNSLRLLSLSNVIKQMLIDGLLSNGHARALISVNNENQQLELAEKIIKNGLSVRDTEKLIKKFGSEKNKTKANTNDNNIQIQEIEENLKDILGTKVNLIHKNNKGKIVIEYYSEEELDRIIEYIGK